MESVIPDRHNVRIIISFMKYLIQLAIVLVVFSGVAIAAPPERIVSLTPGSTELLFALGLEDRIVGVTNACLYPPAAQKKPKIGSMVTPSLEMIVAQRPDLVVASSDSVSAQLIGRLGSLGIKTYVMPGYNLAGFPKALRDFGAAVGKRRQADRMARKMEMEIASLRKAASHNRGTRSVLYLVWPDPPMAAGASTPIHEAIELLGFRNAGTCGPAYYPVCSLEDIISREPDIIVLGCSHVGMKEYSGALLEHLRTLRAVREGRVYYVSDNLYRLGPGFVDGLKELKEILYK
jgi:iron complex transport system substrate-binding protein